MEWTQRLRMRQLYLLVALYESRNISHTAAQMGVTQPGLSKFLGDLEEDLNVKLFKRNSRGLTPTEFCTALVTHARAIIGELDRTQATISLMSIGASGNLVVGTTPTVATELEETRQSINFPSARTKLICCRKIPKRITEPNIPNTTPSSSPITKSETNRRSKRQKSAFTAIANTTRNGGRFDDVET